MCFHSIFFLPAKFGNNQTKVPVDYLQHSKPNTKKNGDKCLPMLKMKWCYIFSDLWQIRENCARYDKWLAATTERCTYIYYPIQKKKKRKEKTMPLHETHSHETNKSKTSHVLSEKLWKRYFTVLLCVSLQQSARTLSSVVSSFLLLALRFKIATLYDTHNKNESVPFIHLHDAVGS